MIIKVKQDKKSKEHYLDIKDFKDLVDISKIVFYKFTIRKDKSLSLKFYDKNNKLVKCKKKASPAKEP